MKAKQYPSQEILRQYFDMNDDIIIRKIRTGSTTKIGDIVTGYMVNGRKYIKFNNEHFSISRLVWIYHNGDISNDIEIDHIDCNKLNDNILNLRLATRSQNSHNIKYCKNTTGHKNISQYCKIKNGIHRWYYYVRVKLNHKVTCKNFPFTENGLVDAIKYRDEQVKLLHKEFGRTV